MYTCEECQHGEVCKYRQEFDILKHYIYDHTLMKLDFDYDISTDVLNHYSVICDRFVPSYLSVGGCNC